MDIYIPIICDSSGSGRDQTLDFRILILYAKIKTYVEQDFYYH
jgi:hypothetical protein